MTRRTSAVLMAPIALAIAADLRASPYPFAMIGGIGIVGGVRDPDLLAGGRRPPWPAP